MGSSSIHTFKANKLSEYWRFSPKLSFIMWGGQAVRCWFHNQWVQLSSTPLQHLYMYLYWGLLLHHFLKYLLLLYIRFAVFNLVYVGVVS